MAYSMFECPKLYSVKSLKFYPEEYDHHIPFRHKNLDPNFDLTPDYTCQHMSGEYRQNYSIIAQNSTHKKCPIYVHNYAKVRYDGDYLPKARKESKSKQRSTMEKLEESYWANWKPGCNGMKNSFSPVSLKKSPEIQVIKSAPSRRHKIQVFPSSEDEVAVEQKKEIKNMSNQEIQTDDVPTVPEEIKIEEKPEEEEVVPDEKFLKHTDSLILTVKKQKEEKEHFDQPKCIRLYRKPGKITSRNVVKGGSYPLKSCLKKDSNFGKGSTKFGRPGSPIIVSSNFSSKAKHGRTHRH